MVEDGHDVHGYQSGRETMKQAGREAMVALKRVRSERALMNQSAARSLDKGFEETG